MLPPELTDRIIDCLHDDKKTLSKCGCVARSWVTRSRMHLWKKIGIDGPYDSDFFLDIIRDSPATVMHIQHLGLALLEAPLVDDIISHLASLPSLTSLIIISCGLWRRIPPEAMLSTTVQTLTVSYLTFPDIFSWHHLVTAFPALQKLVIGESTQILSSVDDFRPPTRLSLQRLELGFKDVNTGMCTWLNNAIASSTTVHLDNAGKIAFARLFMLSIGCLRATEHLEFEGRYTERQFWFGGGAVEFNLVMFGVREIATLRTISVTIPADEVPLYLSKAYRLYNRALPPLDRLTVVFHSGDQDTKTIGGGWADGCGPLKRFSDQGNTGMFSSVVLRAAHPSRWDEHLLSAVASMQQFIPLLLEQQDEDGTVSQVHLQ